VTKHGNCPESAKIREKVTDWTRQFHRNSGAIVQRPWQNRKIPFNPNPYDEREGNPSPAHTVLIMIGVGLDTLKQVESQLMQRNYEGFLK
jgi:hypothetical protein